MRSVIVRLAPIAALIVAVLLPLFVRNEYYLQILTQGYVLAISACGLNVIVGLAGQLSLAHAGFFGIGAYAVALLATKAGLAFWFGLPAGILLCIVIGIRDWIDLPPQQRALLRHLHARRRTDHSPRDPEVGIADARPRRGDWHPRPRAARSDWF